MSENIISLLPDNVANKIAAGEVVQRPASVVKELLENAIDAGARQVKVIIRDAGKSLLQVIDDGKGMNPFDARMCFERHATSKIRQADDLFSITTKGFRGEALASIAAVAQVELKTREKDEIVGQHIVIDGGKFMSQEECQTPSGSNLAVKNLFYNIPARRKFLKSDQVEQKHIIEEIERLGIPHNDIHFILNSNGNEILNLPGGTLMQRIKSLLGSYIQKELVHVNEETSFVHISGYISLPQNALKVKKDQFFFVNRRYIRSPYLNHAVYEAYNDLIGFQSHPRYFIFLDLDPAYIDINIHPTKTEIKFTDEKTVYMLLVSALKRALGKASASPSFNFESEMSIDPPQLKAGQTPVAPSVSYDKNYDPFRNEPIHDGGRQKANRAQWEALYEGFRATPDETETLEKKPEQESLGELKKQTLGFNVFQVNNKYIISSFSNNLLIVDQQRAHERIIYEHYIDAVGDRKIHAQQLLFPEQLEFGAGDFQLIKNMLPEFSELGFNIDIFGKNSIVVNGVPPDMAEFDVRQIIEGILESCKLNTLDIKLGKHENLCRAIASNTAIKYGKALGQDEMKQLLGSLLTCENPLYTAAGKIVMMEIAYGEMEKFFRNK